MSLIYIYSLFLILYLIIVLAIGWVIQKKGFKSINDWSAAGNSNLGWFTISMTIFATAYSAFTFVGMPGFFFTHGIGTAWLVSFPVAVIAPIFMYFIANRVLKVNKDKKAVTPIDIINKRVLGKNSKLFISILLVAWIVFNLPYVVIQIVGVGKVLNALTGGEFSYTGASLLFLIATFLYAEWGGMKGIIWTDVFQGLLALILMGSLCYFFLDSGWGDIGTFYNDLKLNKPELLTTPGPEGKMTDGLLFGNILVLSILSVSYVQIFSRMLLFQTRKQIRQSSIAFAFAGVLILIFTGIIGLGAALKFSGMEADLAIVEVIQTSPLVELFGISFSALFFIGLLSGAMSTADSVLFSLGNIFVHNGIPAFRKKELNDKQKKNVVKYFILIMLIICYIISLKPPEFIIDLALVGISGATVLAPALIALLWKELYQRVISISLILGYIVFIGIEWLGWENYGGIGAGAHGVFTVTICLIIFHQIAKKIDWFRQ